MRETRRSYHQFCGVAKALDVVGERWTLLLVREMLLGPRRYGDLLATLEGLTTNLLAERLKQMTDAGLIEKVTLAAPGSATAYQLTEAGAQLEPVVMALGAWGSRYMTAPVRGDRLNIGWALLSMKRRFRGTKQPCVIEIRAEGRVFQYQLRGDSVALREGSPWHADCVLTAALAPLRALLMKNASARELELSGALAVEGDRRGWRSYLRAFGLRG